MTQGSLGSRCGTKPTCAVLYRAPRQGQDIKAVFFHATPREPLARRTRTSTEVPELALSEKKTDREPIIVVGSTEITSGELAAVVDVFKMLNMWAEAANDNVEATADGGQHEV